MQGKLFLNRLYLLGFYAVAILLPMGQPLVNYALVFFASMFVLSGQIKFRLDFNKRTLFLLPVFFYLIHIIGLSYSQNLKYGLLDIETKFSYFFLPLIFFTKEFEIKERNYAKLLFVTGCASICLYNIISAIIQYSKSQSIDVFYYTAFSKAMHVQYLTIYLNLAILLILDLTLRNEAKPRHRLLGAFVVLFFFINISFLSSRLATIAAYFTVTLFFILRSRGNYKVMRYWPYAVLIIGAVIITDYFSLQHYNRFEQVEILFSPGNNLTKFDKLEYNSTTLRIPLWINAAEVIENNKIFGVGTGDIKEELDIVYKKNKFSYAEASHFSPHNQILHTGIILGFVGIAMLLAILLIPLYFSIRYKSYLLMCFIIIFFFNMMTESILERQAGIILFSFFYVMLIAELYEDIKKAGDLPA